MVTPESTGRIGYLDASKQWGYLYGTRGQRVYFHAANVLDGIADLVVGAEVRYRVAEGGDQLCAAQVTKLPGKR